MTRLRDGFPQDYILVDRVPFAVDMMTWARWRTDHRADCIVAKSKITPKCEVSTVFLGMDHNWGKGDPLLFETMTFGGPLDQNTNRYATWAAAEQGHAEAVAEARIACARVDAIKASSNAH